MASASFCKVSLREWSLNQSDLSLKIHDKNPEAEQGKIRDGLKEKMLCAPQGERGQQNLPHTAPALVSNSLRPL